MKRLLLGFGLGSVVVYGWRRLLGGEPEPEPEPSWQGTDNDPEDRASIQDDLLERTRETAPFDYERSPVSEPEEAAGTPGPTGTGPD